MRNSNIFVRVLVNMLAGIAFGAVSIGLFAFLAAGMDGLVNGLVWGAVFGSLGGLAALGTVEPLDYWTGFFRRYGDDYYDEQSGNGRSEPKELR